MTTTTTKKELSPIEIQVDEILKEKSTSCYAAHLGAFSKNKDGSKWDHDRWYVTFSGAQLQQREGVEFRPSFEESFEYSTGAGLRRVEKLQKWQIAYRHEPKSFPVKPTAASVLYCLLSDAEALDMSFSDWCANFGYDEDSRKALAIYDSCCENAKKLRRCFDRQTIETLREALQDY